MYTFEIEIVNDGWHWKGDVEAENHVSAVRQAMSELLHAKLLEIDTPSGVIFFDFDNLDPQWWIDGTLYEVDPWGDPENGIEPVVHPAASRFR